MAGPPDRGRIPTLPFGRTGHESTRLLFGAAALARVSQAEADRATERLLAWGVNHVDTAAAYGDSELRLAPFLRRHRARVFLATKTGERTHAGAREELHRSLERLGVDRVDLLQLHNLVKEDEWELALSEDGALRALVEARDEGLVSFLGVTGHGTRVAEMHRRSLERFPFDSVLLPYNFSLMQSPDYAAAFERLLALCVARGVAVQTIKSVARRRWREGETPSTTTWYAAFEAPEDVRRAVHWALGRPDVFVNSASDLRLFERMAEAAAGFEAPPAEPVMREAERRLSVEPLFVHGYGARA
jgi:aryl-alcohol dehydrogenase-like predicted oxidoreductase